MGFKKKKNRNFGHLAGVKVVQKIVTASMELRIPIISFYVFSSENWKRPQSEIKYLFNLIGIYFKKEISNIIKNNIKINIMGRRNTFSTKIKTQFKEIEKKTIKNNKLIVNLAINYGSKNEIIDSVKKLHSTKQKITEKNIEKNLYRYLAHPDILIRTGGKKRLSNFMLWQMAYTELFFLKKLWPDFTKKDLSKIIREYKKVKRNFGAV